MLDGHPGPIPPGDFDSPARRKGPVTSTTTVTGALPGSSPRVVPCCSSDGRVRLQRLSLTNPTAGVERALRSICPRRRSRPPIFAAARRSSQISTGSSPSMSRPFGPGRAPRSRPGRRTGDITPVFPGTGWKNPIAAVVAPPVTPDDRRDLVVLTLPLGHLGLPANPQQPSSDVIIFGRFDWSDSETSHGQLRAASLRLVGCAEVGLVDVRLHDAHSSSIAPDAPVGGSAAHRVEPRQQELLLRPLLDTLCGVLCRCDAASAQGLPGGAATSRPYPHGRDQLHQLAPGRFNDGRFRHRPLSAQPAAGQVGVTCSSDVMPTASPRQRSQGRLARTARRP
jgi:hypothetical protein